MENVGAIDIGSNAIRAAVSTKNDKGKLVVIESVREPIRLGSDVFSEGTISEHTTRLVAEAFHKFQRLFAQHHVALFRAVGTSALREARNRDSFLKQIRTLTGISVEIIRGEEEAELIGLAVTEKIDLSEKLALLIDIGGGSVEVTIVDHGDIVNSESAPMGTVRLIKLLEDKKQPTKALDRLIREYSKGIKQQIAGELRGKKLDIAIGTGGNIECLSELRRTALDMKSGDQVSLDEIGRILEKLQALSYQERIDKLGLRPDRADVLFPATAVVQGVMQQAKVDSLLIPGVGLKEGICLELLSGTAKRTTVQRRKQLVGFARELGRKYAYHEQHAETVSRLAVDVFEQTRDVHRLDESYKLLLELAAILHDIGQYVSYTGHHKHSGYLISACHIVGLLPREQNVVAAIARYHRKAAPKLEHPEFARLLPDDRNPVTALAAILRVADALDREHASLIKSVKVDLREKRAVFSLSGEGDMVLETWAVKKKGKLFEDFFGRDIVVETL
ncbi:MAG: Ppx/GppA phosphatase family protein [Bdellovibrionota bacterium]